MPSVARPLTKSASARVPGAPPVTIVERIDQFLIGARVVVVFDETGIAQTVSVAGGAGRRYRLIEEWTVVEDGHGSLSCRTVVDSQPTAA